MNEYSKVSKSSMLAEIMGEGSDFQTSEGTTLSCVTTKLESTPRFLLFNLDKTLSNPFTVLHDHHLNN